MEEKILLTEKEILEQSQKEAYAKGTDHQFIESMELGPWTSYSLLHDPKHMAFVLARYKFCAKILDDKKNILEVGCGDSFGIPIVAQGKDSVLGIDVDDRLLEGDKKRLEKIKNIRFENCNICERSPEGLFDGAYSIDVIEHLDKNLDDSFVKNVCDVLTEDGIYIIGTPNITANEYASPRSKVQHINLKSQKTLKELMKKYFKNVLMFSMNDEVVHTGYAPMAHYIWAVGIGKK